MLFFFFSFFASFAVRKANHKKSESKIRWPTTGRVRSCSQVQVDRRADHVDEAGLEKKKGRTGRHRQTSPVCRTYMKTHRLVVGAADRLLGAVRADATADGGDGATPKGNGAVDGNAKAEQTKQFGDGGGEVARLFGSQIFFGVLGMSEIRARGPRE